MNLNPMPLNGRVLHIDANRHSEGVEATLKALAPDRRLAILRFIANSYAGVSVNDIAKAMDMPTSTATMHINILENAGLIQTELRPASRGLQKVCRQVYNQVSVYLPDRGADSSQ
jgi:predicted transcriptional regulator